MNPISAVVLAGGNSSRMGENKALLRLGPDTMIERVVEVLRGLFDEIIIVTNFPEEYPMLKDVLFTKDAFDLDIKSSLIGLYSGILAAKNDYSFVVACDMPLLNISLIEYMIGKVDHQEIIVPHFNDFYEPLHAIYHKACLEPIKRKIERQEYKILNFIGKMNTEMIGEDILKAFDPHLHSFFNINNYEQYLSLKEIIVKAEG